MNPIASVASASPVLADAALYLSSFSGISSILVMVLGLCLLITIHELGHWFVARLFGFQTPVFSIGFGPRKWSLVLGKFWNTEFRLAPILAGGYVSIPELQDETTITDPGQTDPAAPKLKVFPVWQRICVAAAGVVFNVVSAVIMLFALFALMGQPSFRVDSTVIKDVSTTQVTIARDAGLKANDQVVSVGAVKIVNPDELSAAIKASKGKPVTVVVKRGNENVAIEVTPDATGRIGVVLGVNGEQVFTPVSVGKAAGDAVSVTGNMIVMTAKGFGMMLGIVDKPANVSADDMQVRGIVGIVQMGADAFDTGIFSFVWFLVAISINLAVMNILPLPILDGGHIVFFLIEKVRGGKPVDAKFKGSLYAIFGMLLVGLMLYGLFNDMLHILK
jgi:regulator of sigma E protease